MPDRQHAAEGPLERTAAKSAPSLTVTQAEDLAARTLAAIDGLDPWMRVYADRERVASDLAGLRSHLDPSPDWWCWFDRDPASECEDAARYAAGLLRTAALYGVVPS